MATKNYCFLIPLTDEQKKQYDNKRKREGRTSQGVLHQLVVDYLVRGEANNGYSNNG